MGGGQLRHLAGADHEHGAGLQAAEDLARERDRRVADRYGALAEPGVRAHPFADRERPGEELVQERAGAPRTRGQRVGLLDLAEDLRLADDQRVEAGGDPEQVPRHVGAAARIEMRLQIRLRDVVEVAHETRQVGAGGVGVIAGDVNLGAVAGRQHDRLGWRRENGQLSQRFGHAPLRKVDPFAQVDRRGVMTHAQQQKVHDEV